MPGLTLGKMKGLLQFSLAEIAHSAAGSRSLTPDLLEDWLNQGLYQLDADLQFTRGRETFSTVADQRYYTVPTGVREILALTYDESLLTRITVEDEIVKQDAVESSGTPLQWSWWGADLALYPAPSEVKTVTLHVVKLPTALTVDTDEPTLPPHLRSLIVDFALAEGYRHMGKLEEYGALLRVYRERVTQESLRLYNGNGGNNSVRQKVI